MYEILFSLYGSEGYGDEEMNCEICNKLFNDSMDGLVEKTFHELLHGVKNEYV